MKYFIGHDKRLYRNSGFTQSLRGSVPLIEVFIYPNTWQQVDSMFSTREGRKISENAARIIMLVNPAEINTSNRRTNGNPTRPVMFMPKIYDRSKP